MPSNVIIAITIAHVLTGVASVANRYLVHFLDATEVACLRYLFGAILVLCIFLIERPAKPVKAYWLNSFLLGILFFALFPYLFAASFERISAAEGALLIASMPIWSMLIGQFTGKEKINLHSLIAICLTFIGLAVALSDKLMHSEFSFSSLIGELIMIAAAIIGAIYSFLARGTFKQIPTSTHTLIGMITGFLVLTPFAIQEGILTDIKLFNLELMIIIVAFGCFTGGLAFYLFNWVIKRASATFATMFVPLNPLVAMVLGSWLLNEKLSIMFIIGALVVVFGLVIASLRPINAS